MRRRCSPNCGATGAWKSRPRAAMRRSITWGTTACTREVYRRAIASPGVVVLHDAVLNHFLPRPTERDRSTWTSSSTTTASGIARLGRDLWRARAGSAADERYFRYPMLKRAAERARAVVVHNPAAAAAVKEHASGARVVEIPHLFAPPQLPDEAAVLRYRASLGVEPGDLPVRRVRISPGVQARGRGAGGVRGSARAECRAPRC